jgi:hypothetical protein
MFGCSHSHINLFDSRDILFYSLLYKMCIFFCLDIESEPPPEPAPPEILPQSLHRDRDISMANINAVTIKQPSNFVLKIDKNGDQIHEEFIPQNQHGKFNLSNGQLSIIQSHFFLYRYSLRFVVHWKCVLYVENEY